MNTAVNLSEPRIKDIRVTEEEITAHLVDGRAISVPIAWSWRLSEATPKQRSNFEIIGDGQGIHWLEIDEDISVEGMLYGIPARRPKRDHYVAGNIAYHTGEYLSEAAMYGGSQEQVYKEITEYARMAEENERRK
jgi:hypothetical protein